MALVWGPERAIRRVFEPAVALTEEQRGYPRVEVEVPVEVDVEPDGITTSGNVVNLSRSGLLACVQHRLSVGQRCAVRFPFEDSGGFVRWGMVVRSQTNGTRFLVALRLEALMGSSFGSQSDECREKLVLMNAVQDVGDVGL